MNQSLDYYKEAYDFFDSPLLSLHDSPIFPIIPQNPPYKKRYKSTDRSSEYKQKYAQTLRLCKINLKFPIRKKILPHEFDIKLSPKNKEIDINEEDKQCFKTQEIQLKNKKNCIKSLDAIFPEQLPMKSLIISHNKFIS